MHTVREMFSPEGLEGLSKSFFAYLSRIACGIAVSGVVNLKF
jgi:hypothetical protein